ncbi:MAG: GH32 C-terminal domain-containing protein, partial [Muribaculaceae bacterium]|nr:GH32 C-terminal domain-containing protein [Muribaculaceae bacterium]
DDARINVLVDGKIAETIYVRLAKSKTDFMVPYDLSPYKGKEVILDIVTPQGRSSVREAKEDACWKGMELVDPFVMPDTEKKYRPLFHHAPLYGWMNDPNGMFYKDGVWHLYYQYNPYGSKWQNMTWGHSTSTDLINWEHQPEAIRPDGLGSIFSGSSVIDHEGTAGFGKDAVVALYTSAGTSQMQSLAHSLDGGRTFVKYPGNPVITLESEARDPNMFWNDVTKEWNLVLAHALDHEMLFFTSPDLKTWTLQSAFGKGEGSQDGVWECPDLFKLPVDGTGEEKWVLICNINPGGPFGGSAVQYFVGDWDGKTFKADTDAEGKVPTKWLDYGKDNYALVSWSDAPDGRRTAIGWMSNWQYAADVPTMQFRSANTLPREIGLFKGPDGQIYASSAPSPELTAMRGRLALSKGSVKAGKNPVSFALPSENSGICEILLDIDGGSKEDVTLTLSNKAGNKVDMVYDAGKHTMSFDRRESGIVDFSENFPVVTVSPTFESNGRISLRIFIDRASIEVFGNGGEFVMTNLVFPTEPYSTLSVSSLGGKAKISNLKIYSLKQS